MISTGGSFFSGWRMVPFVTTILPKSAERRKPPFEPTHVEKAQLQKYTASVEVFELATHRTLLTEHLRACGMDLVESP